VTAVVQELRTAGYADAGRSKLGWVSALVALDRHDLDPATIEETSARRAEGREDIQAMRGERLAGLPLARCCGVRKRLT
jgi:hypothetical protein